MLQTIRSCSSFSLDVKCGDNWLVHELRLQAALDYLEAHRWECFQCIITHLIIVLELGWHVGTCPVDREFPGLAVGMRSGTAGMLGRAAGG